MILYRTISSVIYVFPAGEIYLFKLSKML